MLVRSGSFKTLDRSEQRFLFPFNDVSNDLVAGVSRLGNGWTIKPATYNELNQYGISRQFEYYLQSTFGANLIPPQGLQLNSDNSYGDPIEYRKKWRFIVIEGSTRSVGIGPGSLTQALYISDAEILIGARSTGKTNPQVLMSWTNFVGKGNRARHGLMSGPAGTLSAINPSFLNYGPKELPNKTHLKNLRKIIEWRRSELPDHIRFRITEFMDLDRLPDYSLLKHLGYFSILEGLLSHAPAPKDPYDSIARQLERNLKLVTYELKKEGIELGLDCFGATSIKKIVSALYSYRSSIAHGGKVSGALENINKLRPGNTETNSSWVYSTLRKLTRRVLQLGVKEPELFLNIK